MRRVVSVFWALPSGRLSQWERELLLFARLYDDLILKILSDRVLFIDQKGAGGFLTVESYAQSAAG